MPLLMAIGFVVSASLFVGCTTQRTALTTDEQVYAQKKSDSASVDCLLPPQIRQLGRQVTYLSSRQTVRTTATDCEIRGGSVTPPMAASSD